MTNVKAQAQELIKGLLGEGFTYAEIAAYLEDGEALAKSGITDEDQAMVELAYDIAASHALAKESPRTK